jgi:hypothetical protein
MRALEQQVKQQFYKAVRERDIAKLNQLWGEHQGMLSDAVLLRNVLIVGAKADSVEVVEWLTAHGADPNLVDPKKGYDALASAISRGSSGVLDFFLGLEQINLRQRYGGESLLHVAVKSDLCKTHDLELVTSALAVKAPDVLNYKNLSLDARPTPLAQALFDGNNPKVLHLLGVNGVNQNMVSGQVKRRFIVNFPGRTYTPKFFVDNALHAPINPNNKKKGYSTYNSVISHQQFIQMIAEMEPDEIALQKLRLAFIKSLLLKKLSELAGDNDRTQNSIPTEAKRRMFFFMNFPIEAEMPHMKLPFNSYDVLLDLLFKRTIGRREQYALCQEKFEKIKGCLQAIQEVGVVERALAAPVKIMVFDDVEVNQIDEMEQLQRNYDQYCDDLGLERGDVVGAAELLADQAERAHIVELSSGVEGEVGQALEGNGNISAVAIKYNPFEKEEGEQRFTRIERHILAMDPSDRLQYQNNFFELNFEFLRQKLPLGMFGFFLESFARCPLSSQNANLLASTVMTAGVRSSDIMNVVAAEKPALNSIAYFLFASAGDERGISSCAELEFDPNVEVALGITFKEFKDESMTTADIFTRQLEKGEFAHMLLCFSVANINLREKDKIRRLAETALTVGRGSDFEKSLNSVAIFLLFRIGDDDRVRQLANVEFDPNVLVTTDKTFERFAGAVHISRNFSSQVAV